MEQRYTSRLLTHFIGRGFGDEAEQYRLLKLILESGWLLSRDAQRVKPAKRDKIIGQRSFGFPRQFSVEADLNEIFTTNVVCFADIPFSDLPIHISKYSQFGVAFEKQFLISKGASPVFYVCANAIDTLQEKLQADNPSMREDAIYLKSVFRAGMKALVDSWMDQMNKRDHSKKSIPPDEAQRIRSDSFLGHYVFSMIKFWDYSDDDSREDNYYLEREWRLPTALRFSANDVWRVILPREYAAAFRVDFPDYVGEVLFATFEL